MFRIATLHVWLAIGVVLVFLAPVNFSVIAQSATATITPSIVADASVTPTDVATPVIAISTTPQPVPRVYTFSEQYEGIVWRMVSYQNNQILCEIHIEYEGLPTSTDIIENCGQDLFETYQATQPCSIAPADDVPSTPCEGVYLQWAKNFIGTREKTVAYPVPSVALNIKGCIFEQPVYLCDQLPRLEIAAEEPADEHTIISIAGRINGVDFECGENPCQVTLQETDSNGVRAEFWANSSSGVSSVPRTALIRVTSLTNYTNIAYGGAQTNRWVVEVASSLWQGAPGHSCSQIWESLPDVNGLPVWLSSPTRPEEMKTNAVYYYLAGVLIKSGQVSVDGCPDRGMQTYMIPNICGMLRAAPLVEEWQNQFDQTIIESSQRNNVPAMLIKRIFGRESQFWPGIYARKDEVGFGQMTDGGADTLLMWNPVFFQEFCREVFFPSVCSKGYFSLRPYEKSVIRGALLTRVNASCRNCVRRIDFKQAQFSVDVFASSLVANCKQADQVLYNLTGKPSGFSASYIDLWKFTLVNYNAGAGCLTQAILKTIENNATIDWENVSANLDPGCQGAVRYVDDIVNAR